MADRVRVLWEDNDYAVLYKPAGLIVHPAKASRSDARPTYHADDASRGGKTKERSLTDWIIKKYPETEEVGEPIQFPTGEVIARPGIVHRIDRETSGVLVIAKNRIAHASLKKQFQRHQVKKVYYAFVYGPLKDREGKIDKPIGRSKSDFRKWMTGRGVRGEVREAVTYYRVLKELDGASFIEVRPRTGRTHQIRVHLKAINHPIIGDSLYAPEGRSLLGFKRLALHAASIQFKNLSGKDVRVEAPLPPDFKRNIQAGNV